MFSSSTITPHALVALPSAKTSRFSEPPNLAGLWERQGKRVIERDGVYWGEYKSGFFSPLPPHLMVDMERREIRSFLLRSPIFGLRVSSLKRPGLRSGLYVCRPATHSLQSIARKARGQLQRALNRCRIAQVDPAELLVGGMELNRDTLSRHGRHDADFLDPKRWTRLVNSIAQTAGAAIHGAYINGRLASYAITCREGEWLHVLYKMSRAADLKDCPSHALDFTMVQQAATTPGLTYVASGNTSIVPNPGLDHYKRQMGFEIVAHNLCLYLHPAIAPLLTNQLMVSVATRAAAACPAKEGLVYSARLLEGARASLGI